ncbi:asparagine synthase-related protein [Streptomyces millisiae]|uniref:asparagine synthase (glutamine-hydrolyzing) n=1 Tax=Streptomyces millisiae TaxID=3075542 RepID=A0ABU2LXV2_9ACTN|nr:asparagine synthase-related protein [Streptomyces sp. DSM 44918]MDT0321868.1 asparagine synthase-related protein [Streptomyces sp. DSM 44918]
MNQVSGLVDVLVYRRGIPWIVGNHTGTVVAMHVGRMSAVVVGSFAPSEQQVRQAVNGVSSGEALMKHLVCLPGCFHAIVADGSRVWVAGDVAGIRAVFAAEVAGHQVLGDHARPLAEAAGDVRLDSHYLARYLIGPAPPLALAESGHAPYTSVVSVPPGCWAQLDNQGQRTVETWWVPPDDDLPLGDAAGEFTEALRQAVEIRTAGETAAACELSGGMDSSALSALAYRAVGAGLLNLTRTSADPSNDDVAWARLVATAQPAAQHLVVDVGDLPGPLDGIGEPLALDAPGSAVTAGRMSAAWWRLATSHGSRVLLSGKGGDEVMHGAVPYLHLARQRDRATARRHRKGWAALWGAPLREVRAHASHPGPYQAWLARTLQPSAPVASWEARRFTMPNWLTHAAAGALLDAAASAEAAPLHDRPHQHAALAAVRAMARTTRLHTDAAAIGGLRLGFPYADRQVIEAVLSVRGEQRVSPAEYRPLMRAAMRGIVVPQVLTRRTKGGYSVDVDAALRRHRNTALALLTHNPVLADLRVIDPPAARAAVERWGSAGGMADVLVSRTVAAELWARTATGTPVPTGELATSGRA